MRITGSVLPENFHYGEHHVLGAVGVDRKGFKHALGLRLGSSENAVVAKDLLAELVARSLGQQVMRLFVIDGSKALRKAVKEVFGDYAVVQRCRTHKLRNVLSYLPQHLRNQVAAVIRAAYKLSYKEGLGAPEDAGRLVTKRASAGGRQFA